MSQGLFPRIPTTLDLNGPFLSFTQQPVDVDAVNIGQDITLTGIATVSFSGLNNVPLNSGSIKYQWYQVGVGELIDGSKFSGTSSSTLTIKSVQSPEDDGKQYFLRAEYVASNRTGNASNEPLDSNTVTVSIPFEMIIRQQPQSQEVAQFIDAEFNVVANLGNTVSYQWYYEWESQSDYRYFNKETRAGTPGFTQKPSCIPATNGWYTRTGRPNSETGGGGRFDARTIEIFFDGQFITGTTNEDGYVISGNYAYYFGEYRPPSLYGWRNDDQCGFSGPEGEGNGDFCNAFDVCRYEFEHQVGAAAAGGVIINDSPNISGSKTDTLTISSDTISEQKLFCRLTHPDADPSPLDTLKVDFIVRDSKPILNYEQFSTSDFISGIRDLDTGGALTITAHPSNSLRTLCVYSREQDIRVKVTMAASAGRTISGNLGGEGGLSIFDMTIKKDDEYLIKMGVNESIYPGGPKGGKNGGGGLIVIYHKAEAIAVCGGGGGAGINGAGGDGGGISVSGKEGNGRNAGVGGPTFAPDGLPRDGQSQAGRTQYNTWDGSNPNGGRLGGCTLGKYWHLQGKAPCEDLGNIKFYDGDGTINQSTATLQRGFKDGQGFRNNGGGASGNEGGGGGGAHGGSAATSDGSGGGGASGYRSSEINLISTQLGGNTGVAFISFELYEKAKFDGTLSTPTMP